jgi:hypothetical protein
LTADIGGIIDLQSSAGNMAVAAAVQRQLSVQRSNPADTRLPLDQPEALNREGSRVTRDSGLIGVVLVAEPLA